MNALVAIDQLRHMQITRETAKDIALLGAPGLDLLQPANHVAQRLFRSQIEIGVHPHRNVVARRDCPREIQRCFVQDDVETPFQARLQGRQANLPVALDSMPITDREIRPRHEDG